MQFVNHSSLNKIHDITLLANYCSSNVSFDCYYRVQAVRAIYCSSNFCFSVVDYNFVVLEKSTVSKHRRNGPLLHDAITRNSDQHIFAKYVLIYTSRTSLKLILFSLSYDAILLSYGVRVVLATLIIETCWYPATVSQSVEQNSFSPIVNEFCYPFVQLNPAVRG
jgi:hypothetical protein